MTYTLKPSNPVVRFAYLFQGGKPPQESSHVWNGKDNYEYRTRYINTSLCPLFWRCVSNLVACVGAVGVLGALVFLLGRLLFHLTLRQWLFVLKVTAGTAAAVGTIFGAVHVLSREGMGYGPKVIDRLDRAGDTMASGITRLSGHMCLPLIWDMIKAAKAKMCPIVEFKE